MNTQTLITQPIGIFPLPASYLLLPEGTDPTLIDALLQGALPDHFPAELAFYEYALNGQIEAAHAALLTDERPGWALQSLCAPI